jgi:hypothetical protein
MPVLTDHSRVVTKFFDLDQPLSQIKRMKFMHMRPHCLLLLPMTIAQYLGCPFCETRIAGVAGGLMRCAAIAFDFGSYPSQASPPMMR